MGDSDMFSLELPGALTSKKSNDSLHLDDSMTGVHPLDQYSDSPREPRRRGDMSVEGRAISSQSPSYHGVDFGTSNADYVSPDEYMEEDGPLHRRRGLSALGDEATASTASMEYFDDRAVVADFLRQYNCTSMMPQSSKVVVLDNGISIRAAFHVLDENGTKSLASSLQSLSITIVSIRKLIDIAPSPIITDIDSATTWDVQEKDYDGVVTIGDLIAALLDQITDPSQIDAESLLRKLETMRIKQWMTQRSESRDLVCMEPSDTLFEALSMLSRFKVHRVPVIDRLEQNTILYVLTATKIVVFLMKIVCPPPFKLPSLRLSSCTDHVVPLMFFIIDGQASRVIRDLSRENPSWEIQFPYYRTRQLYPL